MKITLTDTICLVERTEGDRSFYTESHFLYHVKLQLIQMGYDVIKKRMWKDGHLVDDRQQYIRSRKQGTDPQKDILVYNPRWAIEGADQFWNQHGWATLTIYRNIFEQKATAPKEKD